MYYMLGHLQYNTTSKLGPPKIMMGMGAVILSMIL